MGWTSEQMAQRAAKELHDGYYVNLGIGLPTLVANYIANDIDVWLQSENGLLGIGEYPEESEVDADLINAGKQTITHKCGASLFSSSSSFAMIRGGHIDIAILGAMEVSQTGDIANWMVPGQKVKGMGGAMDLVAGAKKIVVMMQHCTKTGESKIRQQCSLPLTGKGVVSLIITELGVFEINPKGLKIIQLADNVTFDEVKNKTEAKILDVEDILEIA